MKKIHHKVCYVVAVLFAYFVVLLILLMLACLIIEVIRGEHNFPSCLSPSPNVEMYYEKEVCRQRYRNASSTTYDPKTTEYTCNVKINEPLLYFCAANVVSDRCPWRIGYIIFDKLLVAGTLGFSYKVDCENVGNKYYYDESFFRGEEITFREGCSDYVYYSLTPLKQGKTKIIETNSYFHITTATLDIKISE